MENLMFVEKPKYFIGYEVEKTRFHGMKTLFIRGDQTLDQVQSQISKLNSQALLHLYFGSSKTHNELWNHISFPEDVLHLLNSGFFVTVEVDAASYIDMVSWLGASVVADPNFCLNVSVSVPQWAIPSVAVKLEPMTPFKEGRGVYTFVADSSRLTTWDEYRGDKKVD
ncbi:MAG TPA: hypothetical protein PK317_01910 [Coprothermobacter proteolyticus]|nr:hypothetical protein [Coprothermobacter proteolyticus]